jgi:predicted DNA-binding protein
MYLLEISLERKIKMAGKKLISIRVSLETDNQISQLRKMDGVAQTEVISRAIDHYFQDRVNTDALRRLQLIPMKELEAGRVYLVRVEEDGTTVNITQETNEINP